jgi:hypothetical protein
MTTSRTASIATVGTFAALATLGYVAFDRKPAPATTTAEPRQLPRISSMTGGTQTTETGQQAAPQVAPQKPLILSNIRYEQPSSSGKPFQFYIDHSADLQLENVQLDMPEVPIGAIVGSTIRFTINAPLNRRRFNLSLNNNMKEWEIPPATWSDPEFRKFIGVDANGNFPVVIGRLRDGQYTKIDTVWLAAGPKPSYAQWQARSKDFQFGDVLVVGWTPALLVEEDRYHKGVVVAPFISGVELSGDPTTILGAKVDR